MTNQFFLFNFFYSIYRCKVSKSGEWRKLHNVDLKNLYENAGVIRTLKSRRLRCAGHVAQMRDGRTHNLLLGKLKGKNSRGRPKIKWEDNITWNLKEVVYEGD